MRIQYLLVIIFVSISYSLSSFAQIQESIVKQVIDGNTIMLENGDKIRYIGIISPKLETLEFFSKESYEFNKELVEGKNVKLEFDDQKNDENGYLLAYVYQGDIFINAKIIENGYGKVFLVSPNIKHAEIFLKLERDARQAKKAIWSEPNKNSLQNESVLQQNILSLEKRITVLESEIKELKDKIEQLTKIIEILQSSEKTLSINESKNDTKQISTKSSNGKVIVYISKDGKKYHNQGCRFLGNEAKAITLDEAKRKKLEPCKVCFPDQK